MRRAIALCFILACSPPGAGGDAPGDDAGSVRACEADDDCEVAPWLCPRCLDGLCAAVQCPDAGDAPDASGTDAGATDAGEAPDAGTPSDAGRDCGDVSEENWCGRRQERPRCGVITGRDVCGNDLIFDCGNCPDGAYPRCSASGSCY